MLRVERQPKLDALQQIHEQYADQTEQQDGHGVVQPAHFLFPFHPRQTVKQGFKRCADGREQMTATFHYIGDISPQGLRQHQQHEHEQPEQ